MTTLICKKHGSQKAVFYTDYTQELEVTYAYCEKCCEEDKVNQFKGKEKQRQFDELAKEAEAQEALEMDAKIENLKEKMTKNKFKIGDKVFSVRPEFTNNEESEKPPVIVGYSLMAGIIVAIHPENNLYELKASNGIIFGAWCNVYSLEEAIKQLEELLENLK